jgi:hypothetical protein
MRRTPSGKMEHVLCTVFASRMSIDMCTVCEEQGDVVQCCYYQCDKMMHIMCARQSGSIFYGPAYNNIRMVLCAEHAHFSNARPSTIKDMMVEVSHRIPKEKRKGAKPEEPNVFIKRAHDISADGPYDKFKNDLMLRVKNVRGQLAKIETPVLGTIDKPKAKTYVWENSIRAALYCLENALAD